MKRILTAAVLGAFTVVSTGLCGGSRCFRVSQKRAD